jgi:serine/threonine-protein kinase
MDADRWSRIEQLYHQVAALDGVDRPAFLARACGEDRTLRIEIESLLAEDAGGSFLEELALTVAARLVADEVPVLTGRQFGPYRIGALLGAGGMGDVYRAHDTVLGRDVAIKILPEAFSTDPVRLARFEREAQFLALLSHPNVAAIYGVHESDGIRGLVLELVDGETLAARLERGRVPLCEAVRIVRQVGEGLDAAHQRGIVHRDLKPSNIKIARDGTAKILDFGLAQSATGEIDGPAVGTASYMSPEQARGDSIDKRTDIWAFGCVCFEMLTGVPAFRGMPVEGGKCAKPDWNLVPSGVPAGVTALLKRCLEEDPKRRRRDIGDALIDLDDALRDASGPARDLRRLRWLLPAVGVLVLVTASAMMLRDGRPSTVNVSSGPDARLSMLLPPGMDFVAERDDQIAVSPDGTMVAYVAASAGEAPRLVLRKLSAASEQIVGDAIDVRDPFFSPDGRWIGFFSGDTIRKVSIADGRSQVVCDARRGVSAWWGDGVIVFGEEGDLTAHGIRRVSEDGGQVEVISSPNRDAGERSHQSPQLLPDGRSVIYTVRAQEGNRIVYRLVVQTPGSPGRVLLDEASYGRYVGNSILVYQRERFLLATRLDLQTLTTSGRGVVLFDDISPSTRPLWAAGGGVLVYRPRNENLRFVWVNRDGAEISLPSPPKPYIAPSLSPRGNRIAVQISEDGRRDIWLFDIEHQTLTRLTSDGSSEYPMWTPDGAHVGMARRRGDTSDVYWQAPDGSGVRELFRGEFRTWLGSLTPDMRRLIYMQEHPITHSDLWSVDLDTSVPPRPLVQTKAREYGGRVSPDGWWLAYFSDESNPNQFELYVTAVAPGAPRHRVSTGGAREAVWARGGGELFYRNGAQMLSVRVAPGPTWSAGRPTVLFEGGYFTFGGPGIVNYDVSPDGQRFLMLKPVDLDRTPNLTVVQGLDRLIRDRLPPLER